MVRARRKSSEDKAKDDETSEEFDRFEDLARKLVKVPKDETERKDESA